MFGAVCATSSVAVAQSNPQVHATLQRLAGYIYDCRDGDLSYVYREGEGRTGWFRQLKSSSGRVLVEYDLAIRGGRGNEVRLRAYSSPEEGGRETAFDERFRVMENAEAIKFLDEFDPVRLRSTTVNCDRLLRGLKLM